LYSKGNQERYRVGYGWVYGSDVVLSRLGVHDSTFLYTFTHSYTLLHTFTHPLPYRLPV